MDIGEREMKEEMNKVLFHGASSQYLEVPADLLDRTEKSGLRQCGDSVSESASPLLSSSTVTPEPMKALQPLVGLGKKASELEYAASWTTLDNPRLPIIREC